jgi:penicillin-binding protein 2
MARSDYFSPWLKIASLLVGAALVLGACSPSAPVASQPDAGGQDISRVGAAHNTAEAYLLNWQQGDFAAMYAQLTPFSQDAFSLEAFLGHHQDFAEAILLTGWDFQILSAIAEGEHAQVGYRLIFETTLLGTFSTDTVMNLVLAGERWQVQWEIGMILPELRGGNTLELVYKIPARGRIYASDGSPLAAYENAVALGVVPGEIPPEQAPLLYETLASLSIHSQEDIARMVEETPDDWYLPVVSLSQAEVMPQLEILTSLGGLRIDEFRSRYYVDGGVAPHALGYLLLISEADLPAYQAQGYRQDERVGAAGLEAAFEPQLAGRRGGTLYLISPQGEILSLLASQPPEPAQSITTTLDKTLQMRLQDSLGDLRAAVVVMEMDTGRVLAMVSNPHFDPNAFDLSTIDRSLLDSYFADPDRPLFNRAAQGQYPLGSVFKIITMAAGMETGLYGASSSFICGHSLWVCDSVVLYDWTFGHGAPASGELTLPEGLMRSCNPWFYRIGEALFAEGMDGALSEMALGFGLGAPTGIEVDEAAGNIPETAGTCVNSAQMSIGQGEILVTPLQVATFIAALGNGGRLYCPTLVDSIAPNTGAATQSFWPEDLGTLPISEETLLVIQDALRLVVESPRGTAYFSLGDLAISVSGKTGTAQTPTGDAHAWFAGYTRMDDPDRPDIAVVVLVENGGEGSVMAAPVFRRAVSLYFSDGTDPGGTLPWEAAPFVPLTPTPTPSETSPSGE